MNKLNFLLGERRKIFLEISSKEKQPFEIRDATWELKNGENVVDSGECMQDEHVLAVEVEPPTEGKFILMFTYNIGNEILKEAILISVDETRRC